MSFPFVVMNMILGIVLPLGLQLHDRRTLTDEERRWVWGYASWGAAVYNFGPLSLIAWGYVTRSPRYWWGLARGVMLAEIAIVAQGAVNEVAGRVAGLREKALEENREGFLATMVVVAILAGLIGVARTVYEGIRGWLRARRRGGVEGAAGGVVRPR